MAATLNTDQFLDVLRRSRLVDDKRLQAFMEASSPSLPTTSRDMGQQLIRRGLLTPWQASQLLAGKWKGYFLAHDKYKLMERLGAGGMGQVFLCEHIRMKRLVALKVLPIDRLKDDQSALERFDREARAAAALDHPNIARAHDIDTDGRHHFLVMEFVDGASLQDVIKKHGPLEIVRACHYIRDAAEGLQHAHGAGWVHRDIKPGNLLLGRDGTVKILDMGLARLFSDDSDDLTKKYEKNAVLGTADYLAPEQATHSSDVDIRADIYSLGATFYFLLTGKPPFDDGTVTQKLIWHQSRPPQPIRELRPEIPRELEVIINKMMAKKPVHRYQEPTAIVAALEPWTRQAVEPPADEEMPRLCPALEHYSPAGMSMPASGLTGPASGIRGRGRGGPRSALLSRKSLPRALASDPWYKNKWVVIGGGSAGALLLIWFTIWLFSSPKPPVSKGSDVPKITAATPAAVSTPPDKPKNLPVPPPISVSGELPAPAAGRLLVAAGPKGEGRPDVFPTLTAALEKAAPGETVMVFAPEIAEAVALDARRAGVHIESGLPSGQMVKWSAPANAAADVPLLRLDSVGAAGIKGFEFDGADRLNTLVNISGACAGLRLEDLYLTDAGKRSIVISAATSTQDQPVTLERVRVTTLRDYTAPANLKSVAAIRPSALECDRGSPTGMLTLNVRWCRFEGNFREAVLLESPVDATLEFNRFYALKPEERPDNDQLIKAVSVRKVAPAGPVHVSLVSNTMANYSHLLRLERLGPDEAGYRFVVRSNLVVGTAKDAWVFVQSQPTAGVAKPFFADSTGNVCRPGTVIFNKALGDAVVSRKQIPFELTDLTPGSDGFLRYKKTGDTAVLMTAGADGGPVGVPPLD
jgi:serine/threonine protein kinase